MFGHGWVPLADDGDPAKTSRIRRIDSSLKPWTCCSSRSKSSLRWGPEGGDAALSFSMNLGAAGRAKASIATKQQTRRAVRLTEGCAAAGRRSPGCRRR